MDAAIGNNALDSYFPYLQFTEKFIRLFVQLFCKFEFFHNKKLKLQEQLELYTIC